MVPMGWSLIGVPCSTKPSQLPCGAQNLHLQIFASNRMCHERSDTLDMSLSLSKELITFIFIISSNHFNNKLMYSRFFDREKFHKFYESVVIREICPPNVY